MEKMEEMKTEMKEEIKKVDEKMESYDIKKDSNVVSNIEYSEVAKENIFNKGQSKRIWAELHKVIDSSDVLVQVLDVRDPMGTRSKHIERHLQKNASHKHLVLVLNKCDLVPTWSTRRFTNALLISLMLMAAISPAVNGRGGGRGGG